MQKRDLSNFDKQGHRGCRGLMPENTIPENKSDLRNLVSIGTGDFLKK